MWIPSENQRKAQIKFLLIYGYEISKEYVDGMNIEPDISLTFDENFELVLDKDKVAFEKVEDQRGMKATKMNATEMRKWARAHRYSDWYEPDNTLEPDEVLEDIFNEARRWMQ